MRCRAMTFPPKPNVIEPGRKPRRLLLVAVLALVGGISMVVAHQVQARWKPEYADAPYRNGSRNTRERGWSCSTAVTPTRPLTPISGKASGTFRSTAPTTRSNQTSCLTTQSDGHAVVWYDGAGDHVTIFCFAPGSLY